MTNPTCTFIAGRENRVYKVTQGGQSFALRFKRRAYHGYNDLVSELQWLAEMDRAGLNVPKPIPSQNGALLEKIDGQHVDLVSWLDGRPIGKTGEPLELDDPVAIFTDIGAEMARFHNACDVWDPPHGFTRCHWDTDGLLGENPRWGRFWENPTLDAPARTLLQDFRIVARRDLDALDLDAGLIHADLVRENVLLDGATLHIIDFDDGGFGYRLFDVATALLKNRGEPTYPDLRAGLINGYLSVRPLDMGPLDFFMALRAVTYVGWIVPRMEEPGSAIRNTRFIKDAQDLCGAYLECSKVS
ncbi:MAG: phosphotransferase [Pseudomonadota bacterium]